MGTAQREGGLYYIKGRPVNANGDLVEGAPPQPKDTDPNQQPGATAQQNVDPLSRLADLLEGKAPRTPAPARKQSDEDEDGELPPVAELDAHLATLTTAGEVEALQARDTRKTAAPKYEARLDELKA
jgi:hypothetical protein